MLLPQLHSGRRSPATLSHRVGAARGACLYSRFGRCCTDPLQRCSVNSAALSSTSAAAGVAAMTQACACVFRAAARATRKARYGRASAGSPSVSSFVCTSTARTSAKGSGQQSRAPVKLRRERCSSPVERRQAAARRCRRAQRGVCEPLMGWDDAPARMPPVGEVVRPCESDIRQAAPVPQRRSTDLSRRRADLFLILWRPPRGKQERRRGAGSASACAPARKQRRSGVRQAIARTRLDPEREAAPPQQQQHHAASCSAAAIWRCPSRMRTAAPRRAMLMRCSRASHVGDGLGEVRRAPLPARRSSASAPASRRVHAMGPAGRDGSQSLSKS